jgi:hypothetical protein
MIYISFIKTKNSHKKEKGYELKPLNFGGISFQISV